MIDDRSIPPQGTSREQSDAIEARRLEALATMTRRRAWELLQGFHIAAMACQAYARENPASLHRPKDDRQEELWIALDRARVALLEAGAATWI